MGIFQKLADWNWGNAESEEIEESKDEQELDSSKLDLENAKREAERIIKQAQDTKAVLLNDALSKQRKLDSDIEVKQNELAGLYIAIDREANYLDRLKRNIKELEAYLNQLSVSENSIYTEVAENIDRIRKSELDGYSFELFVADLLRLNGFDNVIVTAKSHDYGGDVTASKDGIAYVIQCKYYTNAVGIDAVQEAYAAKEHYGAHIAVVATNSFFTRGAKKLADDTRVLLWDGEELSGMKSQ